MFLANTDARSGCRTDVKLKCEGALEMWDARTGEIVPKCGINRKGSTRIELDFPAAGSFLLVLNPSEDGRTVSRQYQAQASLREIPLERTWAIAEQSLNALTLDFCRCRVNDREWSTPLPVWKAREIIQAAYGNSDFALEFSFRADLDAAGKQVHFVVETPEKFQFEINGRRLSFRDEGYWVDVSFRKMMVGEYLVRGENRIILSGKFEKDMELESCYLVGEFAVEQRKNEFVLSERPQVLREGNWVEQGYPFFCGSITATQNISLPTLPEGPPKPEEHRRAGRAYLEFQKVNAIVVEIRVNGKVVDPLLWQPWEREVTELLQVGENRIEVKVVNSLRNLLGPHHHRKGELLRVNPGSFSDESNWVDSYSFVPFGFVGARLVWKQDENFRHLGKQIRT